MYGNKIASQNLFTSLKIWRTILNASAVCACMHHHQDQWITAAAGLNTMIAQQPHTSSRAREHGADVCHASLVMQVMCVWTVKKCHGFMWKQTLVASDRKSRHPLHPPTHQWFMVALSLGHCRHSSLLTPRAVPFLWFSDCDYMEEKKSQTQGPKNEARDGG